MAGGYISINYGIYFALYKQVNNVYDMYLLKFWQWLMTMADDYFSLFRGKTKLHKISKYNLSHFDLSLP